MPQTINDPESGNDTTVYTQEEIDAQIAEKEAALKAEYEAKLKDKDDHLKTKLDEFQQGKTAAQLKEEARDAEVAAAKKLAEDATAMVTTERERHQTAVQDFAIQQFVGESTELAEKIKGFLPMINMEIKDDKDMYEKVRLAATMAGLGNGSPEMPTFPVGPGFVPQKSEKTVTDAEYEQFQRETGMI